MNEHFKTENINKLLEKMNEDYLLTTFGDWKEPGQVLLRHDIDIDIQKAHDMAEMEKRIGIEATFFVLVSAHSYNILSKKNKGLLKSIAGMGHEIGLHFDPSLYEDKEHDELIAIADLEATVLSMAIDEPITSISVHNYSVHHKQPLFPQFLNAYDPKIFYDEIYWSDSRGVIKKDIFEVLNKTRDDKTVQILMHPIYYGEDGYRYLELLYDTIFEYADEMDNEYRINKVYDDEIPKEHFYNNIFCNTDWK